MFYIPGKSLHSISIGVEIFLSAIFSYLSFLLSALSPCQGNDPLKKYINTYPIASKSSLRLYSKKKIIKKISLLFGFLLNLFQDEY